MRKWLLPIVLLLVPVPTQAATLYAKLAGGDWNAAATWSATGCEGVDDAGPPTGSDDLIIEYCGPDSGAVVVSGNNAAAHTVSIAALARVEAANSGLGITGSGTTITIATTTSATAWNADPDAIIDLGEGAIVLSGDTSGAEHVFAGGGHTYGRLTFLWVTQCNTWTITGANAFQTVLFSPGGVLSGTCTIKIPAGETMTVLNLQTTLPVLGVYRLQSDTPGMPASIAKTSGVVNVNYLIVTDITATGGATWCAYRSMADGGGNTGWEFSSCATSPATMMLGAGR